MADSGLALLLAACGPGSVGLSVSGADADAGSTDGGDTTTTDDTDIDPNPTDTTDTTDPTDDPPPEPCDVHVQDCPLGQKCAPDVSGVEDFGWCVPVIGDGMAEDPCTVDPDTRVDDCDDGSYCYADACRAFCVWESEWPACEFGDACWQVGSLCMPACSPLLADCAPDMGCYLNPDFSWGCLPDPGSLGQAQPCEQQTDCQGSFVCLEAEAVPGCAGVSCCTTTCDRWELDSCGVDTGLACFMLEPDPWCESDLGVCAAIDWPGGC